MEKQSKTLIHERGGIPLRDYTVSDLPASLKQRSGIGRLLKGNPSGGQQQGWEDVNFDKVGRSLIFASLGLGLVELLVPRHVLRMIGLRGSKYVGLVRFLGLRELSSAALIFWQGRPHLGVWSRVFGDAMDLGLLAAAFGSRRANKSRLAAATTAIAAITALDLTTAKQISRVKEEVASISDITQEDLDSRTRSGAFRVTRSITINRPAAELYEYWHNFENLPNFMQHLEMVTVMDGGRSHWMAKAPAGSKVEWDAEISEDQPNERIAWRSLPGSQVENSGEVRFEQDPHGDGTVVRVQLDYHPPAGVLGKLVAKLFGEEPGQQVMDDLRRFKQVIETGEVLRSDGARIGTGQKIPRPARPMANGEDQGDNKIWGKSRWDMDSKRERFWEPVRQNDGEDRS